MSRRAALPAALSPRARRARRSFRAGPTPRTTARIARTEPRLSAAACRVRTDDHRYALVCRSSDAVEAAGVDLVEQRAAHRLHACSPWTGWCDRAPLSPRTGLSGRRSPCPSPPPRGCLPRLAPELTQPTPCRPSCAPIDVPRVARAHALGSGRNGGVLCRVHVAQWSISRLGPASVAPHNLPISRPDLLGLRCESLPWRQTSRTDQPNDIPARSGRSGSLAATRAADRSRARPASTAGRRAGAGL